MCIGATQSEVHYAPQNKMRTHNSFQGIREHTQRYVFEVHARMAFRVRARRVSICGAQSHIILRSMPRAFALALIVKVPGT